MDLTNQQYRFCCELIWGCVPTDKNWALGTPIFQAKAGQLLKQYPQLDKSLLEIKWKKEE